MISAWTKHLRNEEDKEDFKKSVLSSKLVLRRLTDLLIEEEQSLDRSETDIRVFDLPNWAERQAFKNGSRSMLNVVKKLINLDQQEHK